MYTLIIGSCEDVVIQHFFRSLDVERYPQVIFIEMRRLGEDIQLNEDGWKLPCGGEISHMQVTHVYNRMLMPAPNSKNRSQYDYLNWLLDECYPSVINRPKHTMHNFSKVLQLEVAKDLDILIPNSIVIANQYRGKDQTQQIFKSISSHRSIVEKVKDNYRKKVHEPVLFQQDCGRKNFRVHVLDHYVFVHYIASKRVDYRYDRSMKMQKKDIPTSLKLQCFQLMQYFSLRFAGIDWMEEKGQYYLLEVNPSPGYAFYEQYTKQTEITQCLKKRLGIND
jgi:hypothetical protein